MSEPISEFLLLLKGLPREWRAVIDRRLAPIGLSQARWQPLLFVLRAAEPPTQAEIARHLEIESPTLVRLLDRLAEHGWIERKSCSGDRRARRIHLTDQARAVGERIEAILREVRQQLLVGVGAGELQQCIGVLAQIKANAVRMLAESEPEPVPPMPSPGTASRRRRASG